MDTISIKRKQKLKRKLFFYSFFYI